MPDLDRFLRRFRRLVAPPGRPRPAGVPVDREAALSDELAEVFAAIDAIQEDAEAIRKEGKEKAEELRSRAEEEARRVISEGEDQADEVRAEEAARHRERLQEEVQKALALARSDAEEVRERANERVDELAGRVVDLVLHGQGEGGA